MGAHHTAKGRVLGLKPYRYALFSKSGKRIGNLTFYNDSQKEADKSAVAWAKVKGQSVKRRRSGPKE